MTPITALRAATAAAQKDFQEEIVRQTVELAKTVSNPAFDAAALPSLLKKMENRREKAQCRLESYRARLQKLEAKQPAEKKGGFWEFLQSEDLKKNLELGVYAFFPVAIPLKVVGKSIAGHLGLPSIFQDLANSLAQTLKESQESRQKFFKTLETAVHNPESIEDARGENLLVWNESGFNRLVAKMLEKSGNKKIRNIELSFEGDHIEIKGEYETKLCWVDFKAKLRFEVEDGEVNGKLYKVEAIGCDLSSIFQTEILGAFRKFDIEVPGNASLKDLSWIKLPGIKRIELTHNRLVLERQPAATGPA